MITPLVAVGIPTYGRVTMKWSNARHSLQLPLGTSSTNIVLDDSGNIAAKRNLICKTALEQGADWLFMLGDDVIIPSNAVLQMLTRNKPLITGVYWTKTDPTHPYLWKGLQRGPYFDWKAGELFQLDFAGCDCLLIKTEILKNIEYPWFSIDWVWDQGQASPTGLETEDFYFYLKAKKAGYDLWCDSTVQCLHEDRNTGRMYGLSTDMPQAGVEIDRKYQSKRIADLGCGVNVPYFDYECEVKRFDIDGNVKPDIRCDLRQIPEADETFDVVHSQHVLEHFGRYEAQSIIREWTRILKVGGEFIINVPNLKYAIKNLYEGKSSHYEWWQLYGKQSSEYDFHKTGFVPGTLENLLNAEKCLGDVKVVEENENIKATAIKKNSQERFILTEWWNETQQKPYIEKVKEPYEKLEQK